jgi:LAS superfamily LD-carboxypeptidase LdcB
MDRALNQFEVTGRSRSHIAQIAKPRLAAQPEVAEAFLDMRADAATAGFDLLPVSTFRDFDTQLRIWNMKFSGKKPLYDMQGKVRDASLLSPQQIMDCILNWSALPGGSRHHWGTEIDVVDAAAMPTGYQPKLLPEEVQPGGIFFPMHVWLDQNMKHYGFFRPYQRFVGGMFPEPWHLSYASASAAALAQLSVELLVEVIDGSAILAKNIVVERIPAIYRNHIINFVGPDQQ